MKDYSYKRLLAAINDYCDWKTPGQVDVSENQILHTYPKWGHTYKVEADITVHKVPTDKWTNIFQFQKDAGCDNALAYGCRIPAAWIHKNGFIQIRNTNIERKV